MMNSVNTNNNQPSKSWSHWMNQSTIHKRNVERHCQAQGISNKNDAQLPVVIRVWKHLFTSKTLPQQSCLVKKSVGQTIIPGSLACNEYDQLFTDTLLYYDGGCEHNQQQPTFADDGTTFTLRSINSSFGPSSTATSNPLYRSTTGMMTGLVSSVAIASTAVASTRYNNSTSFTTFLLMNGSASKNYPIESMQIIRNGYSRFLPNPNHNSVKMFRQVRSMSRIQMLLLAWGGYELLSNLMLGPR
jgi:hypothetical protein